MTRRPLASRAHALTRALDHDLAGARARDLDRELDRDLARALDCADALARALDHEHNLAQEPLRVLADNLVRALARARNLACARARARNLIRTLDRAHGRARALNRELDQELHRTRNLVQALVDVVRSRGAADEDGGAGPAPGRVPQGLIAMAVQVLPVQDRDRYREEFRADMHELLRRRQQLGMALRVLTNAPGLRRALTETPRNSHGTPARPAKW